MALLKEKQQHTTKYIMCYGLMCNESSAKVTYNGKKLFAARANSNRM